MAGRNRKRRYKKQSKAVLFGILFVTALLCGSLILITNKLKKTDSGYSDRAAALQKQIEEAQKESDSLEEEEIYIQTKKYVEDVARSRLGLVKPGETYLKPNSEE